MTTSAGQPWAQPPKRLGRPYRGPVGDPEDIQSTARGSTAEPFRTDGR
jgi:hypothetical protein